jgi:uncharacterized protein YegJ (DUF2314 family)
MVWIIGAAIILILGGGYCVYRRRQNKPMYCIVWLLASPRHLTLEMMAELLRKVTGLPYGTEENGEHSVMGDANHMMFMHGEGAYLINNLPQPYMEPEEKYLQEVRDLRLRNALATHQAWLSVDYLPLKKAGKFDTANIYPFLGKVAAELYKEDCLAIYFTENHINLPAEPWILAALRSESPIETILEKYKEEANPEVIEIESGNDEMQKAVAEARARWPEFAEAFQSRGMDDHYAAKFPFSDGENEEFMWISVEDIEGETLFGSLDNEPVQLKNVQAGDRVKVSLKDINDWMIMKDDEIKGGFTIKVLQKGGGE